MQTVWHALTKPGEDDTITPAETLAMLLHQLTMTGAKPKWDTTDPRLLQALSAVPDPWTRLAQRFY